MCDDISPAVPNPIHCKEDIHCVSVPLEPDPWGSQTKCGAQPERKGRMEELESLGRFFTYEVCGRQVVNHSTHEKGEG